MSDEPAGPVPAGADMLRKNFDGWRVKYPKYGNESAHIRCNRTIHSRRVQMSRRILRPVFRTTIAAALLGATGVSGTFTVPTAGEIPPGFSASWAGIGGYTTSDLIQAGVSENSALTGEVLGGQYNAWYEILPASETPISGCTGNASCTVNPGDKVTVDISNAGGDTWNISLTDAGNWSWSTSVSYASSESSAEWIQEAPSLEDVQTLPADVGTVSFGPTSSYTEGGSTYTIAQGSPTLIDESPVGEVNEATTSPLASDGQSFNVCVYAQSCAAP
jgi:hypothetical protein